MTGKKTSDTDPDIIEGVAVEKPATSTGRGQAAGRGKSRSRSGTSKPRSADTSAERATADNARSDQSAGKSSRKSSDGSIAGGAPARRHSMPAILSIAAIMLVLAGIAVQQWMAVRQETRLRAEIETLAAQLEMVNESLASGQARIAAIGTSQDRLVSRLAGLEAAQPQDPAEALATLSARLDSLAAAMDSLPSGDEASLPSSDTGGTLAQAGLGAANAMNAANLDGGDPAQWLPVLRELARAGLDVGDLDALSAMLMPRPAATAQLLAEGADLVALLQQGRDGDSGWWQNTTGRIAGFISLRRSDDAPVAGETAAETPLPRDAFARALRSGGLETALAASRTITPPPDGLADWQAGAQRRLDLDAALAGLMAQMAAQMAAHLAAAGVAE